MSTCEEWRDADEGEVHTLVFEYVREVERQQSTIFERMARLACLYDPNEHLSRRMTYTGPGDSVFGRDSQVTENVIASNVDTVTAVIAAVEVRARLMTDDADWSTQRRARHMEWYAEGLAKKLDVHQHAAIAFRDSALLGTGLVKVCVDEWDRIQVERILVDDVIVDEAEVRAGKPRQLHYRRFIDRRELRAKFPEYAEEIDRVGGSDTTGRLWAGYRPYERNELVVIESWALPIGEPDRPGYVAGRHTICTEGLDLQDKEWDEVYFPIARIAWCERRTGWYAIGLAERIAGHQRGLNKINWQIDRQQDQHAVPTTYVRMADANLAVKTTNRAGTIVPYKVDLPKTVIPQAVSGETYQRRNELKASAFEESGVSRMAAQSQRPSGLDSGAALREYRDQTTQRFAQQEKAFERFVLEIIWMILDCARQLGDKAPSVVKRSKYDQRKIDWSDVEMGEIKVQLAAASNISRTPAGRTQLVLEWAQAGVVSQDEARRLLRHPDTERAMSLYTSALEDIEFCIEQILDGEILVPEPYQNLQMGIWRMQQEYLLIRGQAPEDVREALRQWIVQAGHILNPPAANDQMMPGAEQGMPGVAGGPGAEMAPPGVDPAMMQSGAPQAIPQAALAAQLVPGAGAM